MILRNSSHHRAAMRLPTHSIRRNQATNRELLPHGWPKPKGYSNGIAANGQMFFLAGQIGWDVSEKIVSTDLTAQVAQALRNIVAVLAEGHAKPEHIVRMTWYVVNKAEYVAARKTIGKAYLEIIGKHFPAMTLVEVSGLLEPGAKVEIEVTAVRPNRDGAIR